MSILLIAIMIMAADKEIKPKYKVGDIVVLMDEKRFENQLSIIIGPTTGEHREVFGYKYEFISAGSLEVGYTWEHSIDQLLKRKVAYYFPYTGKKSWKILKKEQFEFTKKLLTPKK